MWVMWLWLWRRWQWMVDQGMRVGVATRHGTLLIGRWFMVGLIVVVLLVVEASIPFHGATSSTHVSPTRRGMMTLAGWAMVGNWEASRGRTLTLGRLRRKVPGGWGWGSALWPPRWCGHGLTDYRGVGNMGPGCCGGLRQLSTASTWSTGPRG